MGREERNSAVEIARQEKNRWKKRALLAEATLARVREYIGPAENGPWHSTYRFDILAILDESPTERETPADEWEYRARASDDSTLWFGVSVDRVAQLAEAGYEVQRRRVVGDWEVVPDDRA